MSDKRKKRKFAAKREKRRQKELDEAGRIAGGAELPVGAVPADHAQQVPNNSYSSPPDYYVDLKFTCQDCGRREVWSAAEQKWYYEVAKGTLYATAVRCSRCRRRRREERGNVGDPHPIKHLGGLLKRVRLVLKPALAAAGFALEKRNRPRGDEAMWIDYERSGLVLRVLFDPRQASLLAECLESDADCRSIASTSLVGMRSSSDLRERIAAFCSPVIAFLEELPQTTPPQD
jgi:hypothetical protein